MKDFRVLMDEKPDLSQQHAPAAQEANRTLGLHQQRVGGSREEEICAPLLCPREAHPEHWMVSVSTSTYRRLILIKSYTEPHI